MATITSSGGFRPSTKDTPLDVRTRVRNYSEIQYIQNAYLGMEITVLEDETNNGKKTKYEVVNLMPNATGVLNALIDVNTLKRKIDIYEDNGNLIVGDSNNGDNSKKIQTKYDDSLFTHNKEIPGAINELKLAIDNIDDGGGAINPNFTIGTVTTLPSGSNATVTLTGTYPNLVLNFGIPGGSNSSGGGSTGGGTDTPVGDTLYMYYGRITAEEAGVTNHYIEFDEITPDMILNANNVTKTKASTMNKKSFGLEEETRECDYLIVVVPESKNYIVTKDNGIGGKVKFDETNVTGSANGLNMVIDGKNYLLYGECLMSPCEMFFYID